MQLVLLCVNLQISIGAILSAPGYVQLHSEVVWARLLLDFEVLARVVVGDLWH